MSEGLLPGIWRTAFLAQTGALEEPIPVDAVARAQKVILGNSVRGAIEVGEIVAAGGGGYDAAPGGSSVLIYATR